MLFLHSRHINRYIEVHRQTQFNAIPLKSGTWLDNTNIENGLTIPGTQHATKRRKPIRKRRDCEKQMGINWKQHARAVAVSITIIPSPGNNHLWWHSINRPEAALRSALPQENGVQKMSAARWSVILKPQVMFVCNLWSTFSSLKTNNYAVPQWPFANYYRRLLFLSRFALNLDIIHSGWLGLNSQLTN